MTQRLSDRQTRIGERFNDFVKEHAAQALVWFFQNTPIDNPLGFLCRIEFETPDKTLTDQHKWSSIYSLDGYRSPHAGRKTLSDICVEGTTDLDIIIIDEDEWIGSLADNIDNYYSTNTNDRFRVVNALIDELEQTEADGFFVPAYRRKYPF